MEDQKTKPLDQSVVMPASVEAIFEPSTGNDESDFRSAFLWFWYAIQDTPDEDERFTELLKDGWAVFIDAVKCGGANRSHVEKMIALNKSLVD